MLTLRNPVTGDIVRIRASRGTTLAVGYALPADTVTFTLIRTMVVGDILRRILEDLHDIHVAAAVISDDPDILQRAGLYAATIRPLTGVFPSAAAARPALGRSLDILVTAQHSIRDHPVDRIPTTTTVVRVGSVHWVAPGRHAEPDPTTVRYVLALAPYQHELVLTSAMLDRGQAELDRWRGRMREWSAPPGRPIPRLWRAGTVAAFDDNLDVAAAVDRMNTLEDSAAVAPGTKFEAFTFFDRLLATDLRPATGHRSRPPAQAM